MNFSLGSLIKKLNIRVSNSTPGILKNKMVLYVVFALAILHSYQLWMTFDYTGFAVFLIIAFASSYMTRNMTVILLIGLVGSHIYKYGLKGAMEGMENAEGGEEKEKSEEESESEEKSEEVEGEGEKKDTKENMTSGPEPANLAQLRKTFNSLSEEAKGTGIEGLSSQTAELLKKQNQLLENMAKLEPLLNKADTHVETMKNAAAAKVTQK
jgi:hypothetical protein